MPKEERKNLGSACSWFQVEMRTAHRALDDAWGAHGLYQVMADRCEPEQAGAFLPKTLIYKVKREQPASKRQKEVLHELLKYHKIETTVQTEYLSRNEISRLTDKIISQYGRIVKR
jgi:DNA polymerase-3 subunit alpha (Gram-positive type)